jgi:hypothetical protein
MREILEDGRRGKSWLSSEKQAELMDDFVPVTKPRITVTLVGITENSGRKIRVRPCSNTFLQT